MVPNHKKNSTALMTVLILIGMTTCYMYVIAPAPVLSFIREDFNLYNNDAALNLTISIVYPFFFIFALIGGPLEQKLGTVRMYALVLACLVLSGLLLFVLPGYYGLLLCRVVFAASNGLSIPFIGAAIMKWYTAKKRDAMNTLNGLFPWLGALIAYFCIVPLYFTFAGSWRAAIGIWGLIMAPVLLVWCAAIRQGRDFSVEEAAETASPAANAAVEKHIYRNLLKRKEIRALSIAFACDFGYYSYFSAVISLFIMEGGGVSEAEAGTMTALSFPLVGVFGTIGGGYLASRLGCRKPTLVGGQVLKFIGIVLCTMAVSHSIAAAIAGIVIFTIGNSAWLPAMYMVPMDLEGMTPSRAGAAFTLIMCAGFIAGTIIPILGGWATNLLQGYSGIADETASHVFGLQWSLLIVGFLNIIAFIVLLKMRESGPAALCRAR